MCHPRAINASGDLNYTFGMIHIKSTPIDKNIGKATLRGGRMPSDLLTSELIPIIVKSKTYSYNK